MKRIDWKGLGLLAAALLLSSLGTASARAQVPRHLSSTFAVAGLYAAFCAGRRA